MTPREALEFFPTKVALAKALGVTKQSVSRLDMDKPMPAQHALRLKYEILPAMKTKAKSRKGG